MPPTLGKDILVYEATRDIQLNDILSKAAELQIPVLIRNFASISDGMGKGSVMSSIMEFLQYQNQNGKPPPYCQIQREVVRGEHLTYDSLLKEFSKDPTNRSGATNVLDLPFDHFNMQHLENFHPSPFITDRDLSDKGIPHPGDSYKLRLGEGVRLPSVRRWMLLSGDGSVSTFHRDIWGFWTAVRMSEGEKLWAWAEANEENVRIRMQHGDIASVCEFTKVFGVLLRPGDLFIMNPGLIHAVVTNGDACALGMHFLLAETLEQSLLLARKILQKTISQMRIRK